MFAPNVKKPILKVDGEWNGKMMAKWASGKNEVFIDVNKLPTYPKRCKPVAQQMRTESRRLWKSVTYNLKVSWKQGQICKLLDLKIFPWVLIYVLDVLKILFFFLGEQH